MSRFVGVVVCSGSVHNGTVMDAPGQAIRLPGFNPLILRQCRLHDRLFWAWTPWGAGAASAAVLFAGLSEADQDRVTVRGE